MPGAAGSKLPAANKLVIENQSTGIAFSRENVLLKVCGQQMFEHGKGRRKVILACFRLHVMFQTTPALFLNNDLTGMTGHHSPALIFPVTLSDDKIAQRVLCLQSTIAEAIRCEISVPVLLLYTFPVVLEQISLKTSSVLPHSERILHSSLPSCYKSLYAFVNKVWPISQAPWCCPNWEYFA